MKRFIIIVVIVLAVTFGLAGTALAVINGQPDGYDHTYVVAVADPNPENPLFCSGVLIAPNLAVTAAHCFPEGGHQVIVTNDPDFDPLADPPDWPDPFVIGIFHPHPDFCLGCNPGLPGFDTHDVGVVELYGVLPVTEYGALPSEGLADTLPMKTEITLVGYGVTHFEKGGGPPQRAYSFTRYVATAQLIQSEDKMKDEFIKVTQNPGQGKGGHCFGDSGGPDLLGDTNTILGLIALGTNSNCSGVGYSYRLDTAAALDFIGDYQ